MDKKFQVSKSININASPEKVWMAMTDPSKIAIYLFGTETITDWKVGSSIIFQGSYDGHEYTDKGVVKTNDPFKLLVYDYWSGLSGLEDSPENYCEVSYILDQLKDEQVSLTWRQIGFANEAGYEHSNNSLHTLLEQIKDLVESSSWQ